MQIVFGPHFQVRFICGGPTQVLEHFFSDMTSFSTYEKLEKIVIFQSYSPYENQIHFPFIALISVASMLQTLQMSLKG